MRRDINELIEEIHRLQQQLEHYWESLSEQFNYRIKGRKVLFDRAVAALHRQYRVGLLHYIIHAHPKHLLTAPVIYVMIIPIALIDLSITLYQQICFRAYGLPRVSRRDYIVIDRHRLSYLNALEKLNCVYCGYANGLIAYCTEIFARTEQYWCPIKHARRVRATHPRYAHFSEYGDAERYREQLLKLRDELKISPATEPLDAPR